jgi:hypothetical protein
MIAGTVLTVYMLKEGKADGLVQFLYESRRSFPKQPRAFTPFHYSFLAICIFCVIGAIHWAWNLPKDEEKRRAICDRVVFLCGIVFGLMEVYKQIYSFYALGSLSYDYRIFPLQFCSLPIYFCLISPILPRGRAQDACYKFLALFCTVGGYLVIGYPSLAIDLYLSLHTMIWHVLMVALGAFLIVACDCGRSFRRDFLPTSAIFLASCALATILNVLMKDLGANHFYMSPYQQTTFVVIRDIQKICGWGMAMASYVLLFLFLGAFPLWLLGKLFIRMREGKKEGRLSKKREIYK